MDISKYDKMKNMLKLNEIAEFQTNWNGYGAEPFPNRFICFVKIMVNGLKKQPELFPTARNSIQIEYQKDDGSYLEFEIFESHTHMFMIDRNGKETNKDIVNEADYINELVDIFYEYT